jgi:hypothetical protein
MKIRTALILALALISPSAFAGQWLVLHGKPAQHPDSAYSARAIPDGAQVKIAPGAAKVAVFTGATAPSAAEMKIALGEDALSQAKTAKLKAIFAASAPAVLAAFAALPDGVQAQFAPVKQAALAAATTGDFAKAKSIVETCVLPVELASVQSALADQLAPQVAAQEAIAAATTVEAVEAVALPTPTPAP